MVERKCGTGFLLLCQFSLWGIACALKASSNPSQHVATAVTCTELKKALEKLRPSGNVYVVEDILCDKKSWGDPVILRTHATIIGIRTYTNTMPTLTFTGVTAGIVVTGTARLVFQTINLNDDASQSTPNEESTEPRPPSAVSVHKKGIIDFVGSWVCCRKCGLVQSLEYEDHKPIDPEMNGDDRSAPAGGLLSSSGLGTMQGPAVQGPPPSDGVHTKWGQGLFASGGIYHICASTMICKADPSAYSAFTYFVDKSIMVCESNPTIVVLHQGANKGSGTPMIIQILAFCVPSIVCIILVGLLLGFLWRSQVKRNGTLFETHSDKSSQQRQITPQTAGAREDLGASGLCTGNQMTLGPQFHQVPSEGGSATSLSFGGVRVDLTRLLGRGGFSSVYKGTFQGNVAAIKVVEHSQHSRAGSSGELAEAKLHRDLYHPYIVMTYCSKTVPIDALPSSYNPHGSPTISLGLSTSTSPGKITLPGSEKASNDLFNEENMCTLIVMEYCERGNLFEAIHDREFFRQDIRGAPNLSVILRAALDVACAMRYLHSKGIVHGDLKPENVLRKTLAEDDRGYICKVSDFGLSRTVPINTFLQTATLGTVTHMPPELLEDGLLGPSADVYSFGIMLWEMISGGFPFQAMGQHDIVVSVVRGVRPPMPTFVTTTLWALIQQCWDGDHQKRPSFISIVGVLQRELRYLSTDSPSNYPGLHLTIPDDNQEQSEFWLHPVSNSIAGSASLTLTPYGSFETPSTNIAGGGDIWHSVNEAGSSPEPAQPMVHDTQQQNQSHQGVHLGLLSSAVNCSSRSPMDSMGGMGSAAPSGGSQSTFWNSPETTQYNFSNPPEDQMIQPNNNQEDLEHGCQVQGTPSDHTSEDCLVDTGQGFRNKSNASSYIIGGPSTGWSCLRSLGSHISAISPSVTDIGTTVTTVSVCEVDADVVEQSPQGSNRT